MMKRSQPEEIKRPRIKKIPGIKGMKDILIHDQPFWDYLLGRLEEISQAYSFKRIQTPVLENKIIYAKLFKKKSEKFKDLLSLSLSEDEDEMCLRSDLIVPSIRTYLEHGMYNLPKPLKLYSFGPVFKPFFKVFKDLRQVHELSCFIFGDESPLADVLAISFFYGVLKYAGFSLSININCFGDSASRSAYEEALITFYRNKKKMLSSYWQDVLKKNPIYILKCDDENIAQVREEMPQAVDFLSDKSKDKFIKLLECLDEMEISYDLDPYLVSDFEYESEVVFEITEVSESEGVKPVVLAAGGRYDNLISRTKAEPDALVAASMCFETVIKRFRQLRIDLAEENKPDIFLAQLGDLAKKKALTLFEDLRKEGISVMESFTKDDLKTQFEIARKNDVRFTLILGQKEILDGTIIIRDMEGGGQEMLDFKKVIPELKKRLDKSEVVITKK